MDGGDFSTSSAEVSTKVSCCFYWIMFPSFLPLVCVCVHAHVQYSKAKRVWKDFVCQTHTQDQAMHSKYITQRTHYAVVAMFCV